MKILAIDTATPILSVGIDLDGEVFETAIMTGLRHSEFLLPAIDSLLVLASKRPTFDLVVCMGGPGSFTGLRIGMATAKGLAAGSGCSLVAVPTLDVLADGFDYLSGTVIPVIDARKQRVYAALYRNGKKISDDLDIRPRLLTDRLETNSPVLFTGPGASLLASFTESRPNWRIDPKMTASRARSLLRLGRAQYEREGAAPEDLGPVYLRKSEAEAGS